MFDFIATERLSLVRNILINFCLIHLLRIGVLLVDVDNSLKDAIRFRRSETSRLLLKVELIAS